jgi:hypothetical protein
MSATRFCPNCGAATTPLTEICPKCGARVAGKAEVAKTGATWQPLTAGILDLIIGVPALISGILIALAVAWVPSEFEEFGVAGAIGLGAAVIIIFAIVAIVGGIFALRKRVWGMALAGSILAFLVGLCFYIAPGILLGIPAIVFTALGKKHFS